MIDLTLPLENTFKLEKDWRGNATVEIQVEESEVLNHFDVKQVAAHFDHDELLDEIGKHAAMDKWGLTDV